MVKGQRDTCSHRDATSPNVQKLSYMRMHQIMNLGEIWLQKLKGAPHKIVQVQSLSRVCTMSVDDVVKRKCHSSYCFLYKTIMCV